MRSVPAFLILTILFSLPLQAQPTNVERLRRNRVVVSHLPDEPGYIRTSGWVVASDDSTLSLDTGEEFVTIERGVISSVELRIPPNREFGIVGVTTGAWLVNYIVIRYDNRRWGPAPVVESTWTGGPGVLFNTLLMGSAGAIPGGLLGMVADHLLIESVRTFRADREEDWRALQEHLEGVPRPWQIGLHSGIRVWNGGEGTFEDRHSTSGMLVESIPPYDASMQWLRRASFHRALSHGVSIGAEWVDLAYPGRGNLVMFPNDSTRTRERDRMYEMYSLLDADGYAVSVVTRPFDESSRGHDFRIGFGAGVAVGEFREVVRPQWSSSHVVLSSITEPVVLPFGMVTAELRGNITEGLTFGLSGDLVLLLPWELPEFEISGSRSNVGFGSATIGFVVGYRF